MHSSIDTKLSLRDGATVMLGGLISEDSSDSNAGVPGLKDIPGLGALFRNSANERKRKELVILITPYILNDSSDAEAATDAFNSSLGTWADGVRGRVDAARAARKLRADQISIDSGTTGATGATPAPNPQGSLPRPPIAPRATDRPQPLPSGTPQPSPSANPAASPAGTVPARPAVQPAPAGQRMINLNSSSGSGLPSNEPAPAAGQPGSSAAPQVNAPIPPGRKPAPAVIDGFSTPPWQHDCGRPEAERRDFAESWQVAWLAACAFQALGVQHHQKSRLTACFFTPECWGRFSSVQFSLCLLWSKI